MSKVKQSWMTNPRYDFENALYVAYALFVIIPILLGFIPVSWGKVADVADQILSAPLLGYLSSILVLVAPFFFLKFYRRDKTRFRLIVTILSFVLLAFIVFSLILLARFLRQIGA